MPLHKLPPNGPMSVSAPANQRPQLQDRRRTLQTISELSTTDGGLPDFVSSVGIENIRRSGHNNAPGVGRTTSRSVKRQSLPQYRTVTNVDLPRRSFTMTLVHGSAQQTSRPTQDRRHMTMTADQVGGWNVKRERERRRHELAITGARVQRSLPDQGAETVMSAHRLSANSRPMSIRHPFDHQKSLKSNEPGNSSSRQIERRASLGSTNEASQCDAHPEASERASTDSSSYLSRDSAVNRSRSGSSNTSYNSQDAPPLPDGRVSGMSGYCAELILQNQNLVSFGESARSKNLNPNRSSRTLSLPTNEYKHMSAPHHVYTTASDLRQLPMRPPHQISAQKARNQALAALTAVNSHSRANLRTHHSSPAYYNPHQNRHASLTSHPPNSSGYRTSASPHRNSLRYYAQSEVQRRVTSPSPAHFNTGMNRGSLHRDSDHPRRVSFEPRTVPKRESLTQWKKEREEATSNLDTDHKARMQERVRRANELEEEKEKELISMGKRACKSESRSCFGGLFAVIRGKSG